MRPAGSSNAHTRALHPRRPRRRRFVPHRHVQWHPTAAAPPLRTVLASLHSSAAPYSAVRLVAVSAAALPQSSIVQRASQDATPRRPWSPPAMPSLVRNRNSPDYPSLTDQLAYITRLDVFNGRPRANRRPLLAPPRHAFTSARATTSPLLQSSPRLCDFVSDSPALISPSSIGPIPMIPICLLALYPVVS